MLRIGQVEATATQDGKYTDGSVAGGIAATRLRAAAFNAMQEELAHIVESAGLALDINDMTQVLKAIQKLTLSRANPFADIKSDGAAAISTALTNLGISDEITRAAAAIVHSGDSVTNLNNAPQNSSVFAYGSAANSPGFNATILTVSSLNDSFDMQIAIGYNPVKVAFRSKNGDTSSWQSGWF
ncbi:pyocin knob domain-containing protein [Citrobacter portucalensis]|uniref:pyocin knob domain-containing protein n=1 Tax=Citrobacter portucalensis TaxID=1639133 RepID=UPI00388DA143